MKRLMALAVLLGVCALGHADNCMQRFVVRGHHFQQQAILVPVIYQVAPEIRQQALALKNDKEYQEFLEFKQWKANKGKGVIKSTPPQAQVNTNILKSTCGKCHSGEKPQGGFTFDGKFRLEPEKFEKVVLWLSGAAKPPGKMAQVIDGIRKDKAKHVQIFEALGALQATKFKPQPMKEEEL